MQRFLSCPLGTVPMPQACEGPQWGGPAALDPGGSVLIASAAAACPLHICALFSLPFHVPPPTFVLLLPLFVPGCSAFWGLPSGTSYRVSVFCHMVAYPRVRFLEMAQATLRK